MSKEPTMIAIETGVIGILREFHLSGPRFNDLLEHLGDCNLLNERGEKLYKETREMYWKRPTTKRALKLKKKIENE